MNSGLGVEEEAEKKSHFHLGGKIQHNKSEILYSTHLAIMGMFF